jgi:hypothetical protein
MKLFLNLIDVKYSENPLILKILIQTVFLTATGEIIHSNKIKISNKFILILVVQTHIKL